MPVGKTEAAEMEYADFRAEVGGEGPLNARVAGVGGRAPGDGKV